MNCSYVISITYRYFKAKGHVICAMMSMLHYFDGIHTRGVQYVRALTHFRFEFPGEISYVQTHIPVQEVGVPCGPVLSSVSWRWREM